MPAGAYSHRHGLFPAPQQAHGDGDVKTARAFVQQPQPVRVADLGCAAHQPAGGHVLNDQARDQEQCARSVESQQRGGPGDADGRGRGGRGCFSVKGCDIAQRKARGLRAGLRYGRYELIAGL